MSLFLLMHIMVTGVNYPVGRLVQYKQLILKVKLHHTQVVKMDLIKNSLDTSIRILQININN